jgi:hypothetical protein
VEAKMKNFKNQKEKGSVLIMAVFLSFALFIMGLTYLKSVDTFQRSVSEDVSKLQSYYNASSWSTLKRVAVQSGEIMGGESTRWAEWYENNWYRTNVDVSGTNSQGMFGTATGFVITGYGRSTFYGSDHYYEYGVSQNIVTQTFADYLYLSHRERDTVRHDIIRFWTPDTLDGKVHSNDTIHVMGSPRFMEKVTTSAGYIDPPYNNAQFDKDWDYDDPIYFPDQAEDIRRYTGIANFGVLPPDPDRATEIIFDGAGFYKRDCSMVPITPYDTVLQCMPPNISDATYYLIPTSGALFVHGKLLISAPRGYPSLDDPSFVSSGFEGRLTIASSDTMIITDHLIYTCANPDKSVPNAIGICPSVLGLISENYIMVGESCRDTIYINAAMAAIRGSISVQDIYKYYTSNEKQSLFIYGSLAQMNRGIVHTTTNGIRGFIEKDYHYDFRLQTYPPPHFLRTREDDYIYYEPFFVGN